MFEGFLAGILVTVVIIIIIGVVVYKKAKKFWDKFQ